MRLAPTTKAEDHMTFLAVRAVTVHVLHGHDRDLLR